MHTLEKISSRLFSGNFDSASSILPLYLEIKWNFKDSDEETNTNSDKGRKYIDHKEYALNLRDSSNLKDQDEI